MTSLLISPSKTFFISITVFCSLARIFNYFRISSLSLHYLSIFTYHSTFFFFFLKFFSTFFFFFFDFLPDNSNFLTTSDSGSCASSVSSNSVFAFSISYNFVLKGRHNVLGKRKCSIYAFSNVVVRCAERRSSILYLCDYAPGFLVILCLWTVNFTITFGDIMPLDCELHHNFSRPHPPALR